jgi:hypothetical protein
VVNLGDLKTFDVTGQSSNREEHTLELFDHKKAVSLRIYKKYIMELYINL